MPYSIVPAMIAAPIVAAGVSMSPTNPAEDLMYKFFVSLASIMILVIGFFAARTLRQIDINQKELFQRMNCLSDGHHELRGEHNAYVRNHIETGK